MPLDLEKDDESIPYDEGDDGFNDIGNIGTSEIVSKIRSDTEIILLEAQIINDCTDLDPISWINIYGKKFRDLMNEDSSGTISQIKRRLYFEK